jgi:hypothetical protein
MWIKPDTDNAQTFLSAYQFIPLFHGVKAPELKEAFQGPHQHLSYQQKAVLFCMVGPSYQ